MKIKNTLTLSLLGLIMTFSNLSFAQTNVFDDVIATSSNHTYLEAALLQEGLDAALRQNPSCTVFAPDDNAFNNLASALGVTISDLLALPNLSDILIYHVLNSTVLSTGISNGAVVSPLSTTNTLKLTKTSSGVVYVNHSQVSTADITADNGVVHVVSELLLPDETVADIAIDNGFTTLVTAVIQEELLPVLTNPTSSLTVFAPTDAAFDDLAIALGTNLSGVLANPDLTNILLYHTLDSKVLSSDLSNGSVTTLNGQDFTVDLTMGVMINDAHVTTADILADNGVVHILDKVLLPPATSTELIDLPNVSIYPNPSSNFINIQNIEGEYSIVNMIGNTISKGTLNNNKIDISNFSNGVYIIKISNQKNNYLNSFIKE